ncbi:MAG: hypothetical protein V1740_08515, partial [Candidatus Woesearchaeota archaeon]
NYYEKPLVEHLFKEYENYMSALSRESHGTIQTVQIALLHEKMIKGWVSNQYNDPVKHGAISGLAEVRLCGRYPQTYKINLFGGAVHPAGGRDINTPVWIYGARASDADVEARVVEKQGQIIQALDDILGNPVGLEEVLRLNPAVRKQFEEAYAQNEQVKRLI